MQYDEFDTRNILFSNVEYSYKDNKGTELYRLGPIDLMLEQGHSSRCLFLAHVLYSLSLANTAPRPCLCTLTQSHTPTPPHNACHLYLLL